MAPVFNNAGQHWNHILFWQNMSPNGGKIPGALEKKITEDFGGVAKFKDAFKAGGVGQFGSGWVWLVLGSDGKLKVTRSPNGSNPLATGEGKVLLGCDVWEHSYYLDFRNVRPDYLQNWIDKLGELRIRRSAAEGGLISVVRGARVRSPIRPVIARSAATKQSHHRFAPPDEIAPSPRMTMAGPSPPSPSPAWDRSQRSAAPRWRSYRAAP